MPYWKSPSTMTTWGSKRSASRPVWAIWHLVAVTCSSGAQAMSPTATTVGPLTRAGPTAGVCWTARSPTQPADTAAVSSSPAAVATRRRVTRAMCRRPSQPHTRHRHRHRRRVEGQGQPRFGGTSRATNCLLPGTDPCGTAATDSGHPLTRTTTKPTTGTVGQDGHPEPLVISSITGRARPGVGRGRRGNAGALQRPARRSARSQMRVQPGHDVGGDLVAVDLVEDLVACAVVQLHRHVDQPGVPVALAEYLHELTATGQRVLGAGDEQQRQVAPDAGERGRIGDRPCGTE